MSWPEDDDMGSQNIDMHGRVVHHHDPAWYKPGEYKCQCPPDQHELISELTAYSDGGWFLRKCKLCGKRWSSYIEG